MPASKIVKPFVATLASVALIAAASPLWADDEAPLGGPLDFRPPKKLPVKTDDGSAERAIANFKVASGLKVKLWAAEPMLSNPNSMSIDEKGVVYISEANRFKGGVIDIRSAMNWLEEDISSKTVADRVAMVKKHANEKPGKEAIESTDAERIMRIEDTTGSGVANKFSVFSEGYNRIEDGLASGVFAYKGDVYATIIPNLYKLKDKNNDGKADSTQVLSTGYGVRYAFLGHDLHGMVLGPDHKLYFSIGDRGANAQAADGTSVMATETGSVFRCELDGSDLELFATGLRNPQELRFDNQGNLFTGDNNPDKGDPARWVYVVENGDSGWRVGYQAGEKPRDGGPWIAEQIFQTEQFNNANYIVPHVAHAGAGPSGVEHYSGVGLPAKYANAFFMCDYRGAAATSGIWAFKAVPKGASFELQSIEGKPIDRSTKIQDSSIFYGTGVVDCEQGPDGSLYFADWTQGWDRPFRGRVYRIVDESQADGPTTAPITLNPAKPKETITLSEQTKELIGQGMDKRPDRELAKLLSHADQRVRREAQFALAAKGADGAMILTAESEAGMSPLGRLHGIWGLGQVMRSTGSSKDAIGRTLINLLTDKDLEVHCQAAHMLGYAKYAPAYEGLAKLAADPEPRARYFAAMALGKIGKREAVPTLVAILKENADRDGVLRFGAVDALSRCADEASLVKLATDESTSARLGAVLALRRMNSPAVAKFLKDADRIVVLEAARAIHDAPIEAALPELAALAEAPLNKTKGANEKPKGSAPGPQGDPSTWLMWRVVNANYRVGDAASAQRLAAMASRDDLPDEVRSEALRDLAEWAKPGVRDRITNLARPLANRDAAPAREAAKGVVDALAKSKSDEVKVATARLMQKYGLGDPATLAATAKDAKAPADVRLAAIGTLVEHNDPQVPAVLQTLSTDKADSVRRFAIATRAKTAGGVPEATAVLDGKAPAGDKQAALVGLGESTDPQAVAVLTTWAQKLVAKQAPAELELEILDAAARKSDPKLAELVKQFNGSRDAKSPIGEYHESLAGGDAKAGFRIFSENAAVSCVRCHAVNGQGGVVGPALDGISLKHPREYLLESIVAPNAAVAPGFDTALVQTKSAGWKTGVVVSEDDKELVLRNPEDNALINIAKTDIKARERGPSAMPEGLHKALSKHELRDLVEWLASLKEAPKAGNLDHGTKEK